MPLTDVVIKQVRIASEEFRYRTPIKFGGVALDRVTVLDAEVLVESLAGKRQIGKGSMPLGNVWAFPSKQLAYDQTLAAMRGIAESLRGLYEQCNISGHPIDLTWKLEHSFSSILQAVAEAQGLKETIPALAGLVAASPIDAALHDAYGKIRGVSCYETYGQDFLDNRLDRLLGPKFKSVRMDEGITRRPVLSLPMYHLVGALDPLESCDVITPVGDGLPETLEAWIQSDGLTHLKVKLNGEDLDWDVERVLRVNEVARKTRPAFPAHRWRYSLDFNEKCAAVSYLLEFMERIQSSNSELVECIAYIEQPTARDLAGNRHQVIHAASRIVPVVIDESLVDLESLLLAREMGYTGIALKACKGQTQSIVLAAAARHLGMSMCVQDLTCPGASLIHSAGLAAHIQGVSAIEANSRQYCPAANRGWDARFPGIFTVRNGSMNTGLLTGNGLGAFPCG